MSAKAERDERRRGRARSDRLLQKPKHFENEGLTFRDRFKLDELPSFLSSLARTLYPNPLVASDLNLKSTESHSGLAVSRLDVELVLMPRTDNHHVL